MNTYKGVPIGDTDSFSAQHYPGLRSTLYQIRQQTIHEPLQETVEMLLSFVKEHWLDGRMLMERPGLAFQITSGALPICELESLFAASRNNIVFKTELETYIRETFQSIELQKGN